MAEQTVIGDWDSVLAAGLPERYLCRDDRFASTDADGFLDTGESFGLVALPELLRPWCSLVLAPPWMGKTFVSKAMEKALLTGSLGGPNARGFTHVHRTCFELPNAHDALPPSWWESWRHSDGTACWIIDAIDEGHHRKRGTGVLLADILEGLDDRERSRLRVVMFSRQKGLPEGLPDRLAALDVHRTGLDPVRFTRYQFGPLTHEEAARIVGGKEELRRVVQIIRQHDLQDEARYPKILEHLAKLPSDASVTTEGIWRDLLMELLTERNPNRQNPPTTELEDRFKAAAHIAAVLTLTGKEEFTDDGNSPSELDLNEIVPHTDNPRMPSRKPAREALDSALFHRTATGYRFAQRNIQEKLCAFGLKRLRLSALKPMMADRQGRPFGMHVEALNFLGFVTEHEKVRKWVGENTSLLESDAPRLSLTSAKEAITRLVKIVQKTPYYLHGVDLRRLAAPKIERDLRRRLRKWNTLKPTVLRLLLDISAQTGAKEVVPLACKIALDSHARTSVRRSAVRVVGGCGTDSDMKKLESLAMRPGRTDDRRNLAAAVARRLLDRGIWDISKASRHALPQVPHTLDSIAMLLDEIKKKATPEDARTVIRQFLKARKGIVIRPSVDPLSLEEPREELLSAMVTVLVEQAQLSALDLDVLAWAAISVNYFDLPDSLGGKLARKVSEHADIRRKVFELGLQDSQEGANTNTHRRRFAVWEDVLQYDDIDWLDERAQSVDECPEFVWMHLLSLAYHRSEGKADTLAQKRHIGKVVRQHAPQVFDRFIAGRRAYARAQRRLEQRKKREEEGPQRFSIEDIVKEVLGEEELGLQQKLWKLSWICFVEESFTPNNVDGQWTDLGDDVRDSVLRTCLSGLEECDPTLIPDGSSYSATIAYEASAFVAMLRYRDPSEWLTPKLIKKWLPSVLRASANEDAWACGKCLKVSRPAAREVALNWVDREFQQEDSSEYVGAEFPAELWDDAFADEIAKRVRNPQTPAKPRTGLIKRLAARSPQHALPIAQEWVQGQSWEVERERPLLGAGLDVLLDDRPEIGWPTVKQLYEAHGQSVILGLDAIGLPHGETSALDEWPSDALSELGIILHKEFPPTPDEHQSGSVRPSDEARWARDRVTRILLSRGAPASDALQGLADAVPGVKKQLKHHQAEGEASSALDTAEECTALPLADVLRVLAEAEYRLIRTGADLLTVLIETLKERISADSGEHLSMLYDRERKHLPEDALQAYIACRLKDLLPGKVLHRETQIQRRKRTDILVESPTFDRRMTAVVIEVKWSDNRTTKDSLAKQLGKEYLLKESKEYGIYLVGWSGHTSWGALKEKTFDCLLKALRVQAHKFCRRYEGTEIEVVVLPLQWSDGR